ncbi:MAG TPA: hypothetical protein P5050_08230 [Bacteroidia bacterium]|nr:hypothetical protein [Bacteroidia bacterium]HRS59192.1 hypothetical protein [Bacteroidia bacterium]HRU67240.1 hypothetical protein [Bacteroidia bacterium]
MKKFNVLFLLFAALLMFFGISCEDTGPGKLTVVVKADGKYWPNVTVKLYLSAADRDVDNAYLDGVTGPVSPEQNGAVFTNLPPQTYYLKAIFSDGQGKYEGNADVSIAAGEDKFFELQCTKMPTGNLKVFVRKDLPSGVYMGGVNVYLYKSEADRNAGTHLMVSQTSTDNPQVDGAVFNYLTFQRYYLKANFETGGQQYEGLGDVIVPVNSTTSYHLVCTPK